RCVPLAEVSRRTRRQRRRLAAAQAHIPSHRHGRGASQAPDVAGGPGIRAVGLFGKMNALTDGTQITPRGILRSRTHGDRRKRLVREAKRTAVSSCHAVFTLSLRANFDRRRTREQEEISRISAKSACSAAECTLVPQHEPG